ncbi:hypothetical protein Pcinc_007979 [Petrolisthes cinctipes]|uniref:Uncharacterized protein n=1 Tax=Petrolisthes cinctipes TaxID=88211 RepID=A0AAE1G9X1_PETCI|nr:hypothetical protein Pcinc_007979 [Petrolisthes cinctipes]
MKIDYGEREGWGGSGSVDGLGRGREEWVGGWGGAGRKFEGLRGKSGEGVQGRVRNFGPREAPHRTATPQQFPRQRYCTYLVEGRDGQRANRLIILHR